jgi:hypothetical protein
MLILPDTRDLINLTERDRPVTANTFAEYLRTHNHRIALTFTNIRELAGPIARGGDFLQIRRLLQILEAMPHTYLREAPIVGLEIRSAVEAFDTGTEYQAIPVYVTRWDRTLMMPRGQEQAAYDRIVGLRLDEIVYDIYRTRPQIFARPEHHVPALIRQFEEDRQRLRAGQALARTHFVNAFRRHSATHGVPLPVGREEAVAEWVYENPNRCPGQRLHHETYRQLMANYGDVPEVGDFSDLAHVFSVPYVEAAILDDRMRNYCSQASQRLSTLATPIDYRPRLYRDVGDLMQRNP